MKKIILIFIIFLSTNINYSYWEEFSWTWEIDIILNEIISNSWAENIYIPEPITKEIKDATLLEDVYAKRKEQIKNLIDSSKEEKDIEAIENLKLELEIKKDTDEDYLKQINSDLSILQEQIQKNNDFLEQTKEIDDKNSELVLKIKQIQKNNITLRKQSKFKEDLIKDLKATLNDYQVLEWRYKNLLSKYIDIKKEKEKNEEEKKEKKLKIFYLFILLSLLIYLIRFLIAKKANKKYDNSFVYFDLIYTIFIILALIAFFFYFFPQLYIMLLFISWYLLYINSSLIGSFVWSIIILKNYNIWDVIKHKKDFWKIIKITPLFTVIRILNSNWILTNRRENIPNILLTKEQVTIFKNPELQEHDFNIILPIKNNYNIFKIVEEIKTNIILKSLTNRPINVDKNDDDVFKTKYHQIDLETVKISFFWIDENVVSRKIERKILGYIKEHLQDINEGNEVIDEKEIIKEKKW